MFREEYVTQSGQNAVCNGTGRRGAWNDWAFGKGFDDQTEEFGLDLQVIRSHHVICEDKPVRGLPDSDPTVLDSENLVVLWPRKL